MDFVLNLGSIALYFWRVVYWSFIPPFKFKRVLKEIYIEGVESLPLASAVAFFVGVILALQSAYQLKKLSSEIYIASLVTLSLARELAPVLTSLVVAGRVGSSIAAQIGTMKITQQLDALQTLATSPVKYIVVPKFLSMMIAVPVLVIWANFVGMFGGFLVCVTKLNINPYMYIRMSFESLQYKDYFTGLFKAFVFGIIISIICSYEGFQTKEGAEAVGHSTTVAVVKSFFYIIAVDCILTFIFFFVL